MSLSDLASLGSFVSGVAVLASLVFLFFQMRQMTEQVRQTEKNQRSLINQNVAARDREVNEMGMQIAGAFSKTLGGETEFSLSEVFQLNTLMRAFLGQMQDVYVQRQAGLIEQDTYDFVEAGVRFMLSIPYHRVAWRGLRPTVSPKTAALVEDLLATTPALDTRFTGNLSFLKSRLEEMAHRRAEGEITRP